jgi:hypothetical protein
VLYMKTNIKTPAIGLEMEKKRKSNGDAQFDSTCHPSHAAVVNDLRNMPFMVYLRRSVSVPS